MTTITAPLAPQAHGPAVAALHIALIALGHSVVQAERAAQRYGPSTRAAVSAFQLAHQLPETGEVDAATAAALNAALAANGAAEPAPPESPGGPPAFSVRGEVVRPDGAPLAGLRVRALDRGLGTWRSLGEARTDERGHYTISYAQAQLAEWGKTRADLKVEARDEAGATVLAESALILEAMPHTTVNLSLGPGRYRGPDEFSRVERALAPLLNGQEELLGGLLAADVLILAREAGVGSLKAAHYLKARRWAALFDAPAALFYGLLRRGEPAQIDALLARSLPQLWARLEQARARNLIGLPLDETTRAQLGLIQQGYLTSTGHPCAQLLATTALSPAQRSTFTHRLASTDETSETFWQAIAAEPGFGPASAQELQDTFELQAFTGGNTSLTLRLRRDLGLRAPREVAAFSVEQWRDMVLSGSAVELPTELLPGGAPAERRAAYAQLLFRRAERRYPTAFLAGRLTERPLPGQAALSAFFENNPDVELRDQRLLNLLRERPEALDGLPETARAELLRLEQLFHLTPPEDKLDLIESLWQAGLRSAPQIAALGRANLLRRVGPALGQQSATAIYRKAVHVSAQALSLYLRFNPQLNRLSTPALRLPQLPTAADTDQALGAAAISMPEWEELFGPTDVCAVAHAESAIGPGAYLLHLMAFLDKATDAEGNSALDELLARRPGLGTLRLTTANAETPMPRIDLVIEEMEAIVASPDGKTLSGDVIGETTWDSARLAAQPEHTNVAAYEVLRSASYPFFKLPFDLWAVEGRCYLRQMGLARHELMRAMPPRPGVGLLEIATEAMGMSSAERELIAQPLTRPEDVARAWGIDLAQGPLGMQLASIAELIAQAQLSYEELLRLLNTRSINPGRRIAITFAGAPCDLGGAVLADADGAELVQEPFRALLDRLHRFLRLQRRLDCDPYDLDQLIQALGVADFDAPGFFTNLADAQILHKRLGLTLPELSALWANLDVYKPEEERPAQYEAIFLDEALFPAIHSGDGPDLPKAVFALRADEADIALTNTTDPSLSPWLAEWDGASYKLHPDYAPYIQSAARITADDLLHLVGTLLPKDAASGHVALNLANLSLLYRAGTLARALGLSVRDSLRLSAITGVAPLRRPGAPAGPSETRRFVELVTELQAAEHSVETLAYLLGEPVASAALAPTPEAIDVWLASAARSFTGILALTDPRITPALKTSLAQSLGAVIAFDSSLLDALLFTHRPLLGDELLIQLIVAANPAANLPSPRGDMISLAGQLHKAGRAWAGLNLDPAFFAFVLDQGPGLGWADIADLPMELRAVAAFEPWRRLVAAAALQGSTFSLDQPLFGLLEDAASPVSGDLLAQLSAASGWTSADLTYLAGPSGFNLRLPEALRDERALIQLKAVFDLIRSSGASAEQAHAWAIAELGYAGAQAIKQTLALSYPPAAWLDVLGAIQDELRPLKRDALLGHLLTSLGMEDSAAFYRHYLIDPDESPASRTSRIVAAHEAIQLFVERILLSLEPFHLEHQDTLSWEWRKRYRTWEAACKIFLWPENWLDPELRDNQSPFFQELADGLQHNELTQERAEALYLDFIRQLDLVSQLEIVGMYRQEATDELPAVLHVFGRTGDEPRRYFYRRWEDEAHWTPWERVELDIEGDHLIPIVSNGRLYLFWPTFSISDNPDRATETTIAFEVDPERADELRELIAHYERLIDGINEQLAVSTSPNLDKGALEATRDGYQRTIDEDLQPELDSLTEERTQVVLGDTNLIELGMKWSEYRTGGWTSTATSRDKLSYTTSDRLGRHYFTGWVDADNVLRISARINLYGSGQGVELARSPEGYIGYFYFDAPGGSLVGSYAEIGDPAGEVTVTNALPDYHAAEWYDTWWSNDALELEVIATGEKRLLIESPGRLVYAHQDGLYGKVHSPFFFSDGARTYFVNPVEEFGVPGGLAGELLVPSSQSGRIAARTASLNRGASLQRLAASSTAATSAPATNGSALSSAAIGHHFSANDAGLVMQHVGTSLASSSLPGLIGTLIKADPAPGAMVGSNTVATQLRYRFTPFFYPHTGLFLRQLARYGTDGLLRPDPAWGPDSAELVRQLLPSHKIDFEKEYKPNLAWVSDNFASEQLSEAIDFDYSSAYSGYTWETFYHAPMLIATQLMRNRRFADARRWLHAIFDPTVNEPGGPQRFWRVKPFYEEQLKGPIEGLEQLLAEGNLAYEQQVAEWETKPFVPDAIARLRIGAYMQATLMLYMENLIQWADDLFRRETGEDSNEARQLYLLVAELLGAQPTLIPAEETADLTPNLLLGRYQQEWNGLSGGHPLDPLAAILAARLPGAGPAGPGARVPAEPITVDTPVASLSGPMAAGQGDSSSVDTLLLFGLPHNERLLGYWTTVADRLFKLRHSMNLAGQVRQLALFSPPIDPALLMRAAAMGMDVGSVLSTLFTPRSIYRFSFLVQKALELCAEARGLGAALLANLEKQDAEELALLRGSHEVALVGAIRSLKEQSIAEADAALAGLRKSREAVEQRLAFYGGLERMSAGEQKSLDSLARSQVFQQIAQWYEIKASGFHTLPNISVTTSVSPSVSVSFGGSNLGAGEQATAGAFRAFANQQAHVAGRAGTVAGYGRRFNEWRHQANAARTELAQLDKQLLAAEIRTQISRADRDNQARQLAQSEEAEELLRLKFSSKQLYSWHIGKLSAIYFQAFQQAQQLAVQAETAFREELGQDDQAEHLIRSNNWDSLKQGLTAGEQLYQQLRQLEATYIAANSRELEITKQISLFQLDPAALLELRERGSCSFDIPEVWYNLDFASHYFRRIRAVRLSIPCIAGPYTSVSATLRLTDSWTRRTSDPAVAGQPTKDSVAAAQVAIATSTASLDGGAFELSFRDERYLPFEGAGAISRWKLDLPSTIRPFDYRSIGDLVIQISYSARDGGQALGDAVSAGLLEAQNDHSAPEGEPRSPARLISLREQFPSAWHQLITAPESALRTCTIQLGKQHFPASLDYVWQTDGERPPQPQALALTIGRLVAHLCPLGPEPAYAGSMLINQQPDFPSELGIPSFDLTGAPGALSSTRIAADELVSCNLTIEGMQRAADWSDICLLLEYSAGVV